MLQEILDKGLSVRQTEDMVRNWQARPATKAPAPRAESRQTWHHANRLQRALETKVAIRQDETSGAGTISIHFYDKEHLAALLERIAGAEDF